MKLCPICRTGPNWHLAANVTRRRAEFRTSWFLFEPGCRHGSEWARAMSDLARTFLRDDERSVFEKAWDNEAERLFAEYTATWTEPQRAAFRDRVFPEPAAADLFQFSAQRQTAADEKLEREKLLRAATARNEPGDESPF